MRSRHPEKATLLGRSLSRLALVLASVLVTLVAAEIALRFTHYRYAHLPYYHLFPDGYFRPDPELGAEQSPNQPPSTFLFRGPPHEVFTNRLGCFDLEREIEAGYVLAIGDSYTWGYTPLDRMWTSHLERLSGRQVLKCGVSATGTRAQLVKATRVIEEVGIAPDLILLLYIGNDFNDDATFPRHAVVEGQRVNNLKRLDLRTGELTRYTREELQAVFHRRRQWLESQRRLLRHRLVTVRLLGHALDRAGDSWRRAHSRQAAEASFDPIMTDPYSPDLWQVDPARHPWVAEALELHLENLRQVEKLADRYGSRFVLVDNSATSADGVLQRRLRSVFADLPHRFDVRAHIARTQGSARTYQRYNGHWNERGNRLAAEGIYRFLIENGLL